MEHFDQYLNQYAASIDNITSTSSINGILTSGSGSSSIDTTDQIQQQQYYNYDNNNYQNENCQTYGYQLDNGQYKYQSYPRTSITPPSDYHNPNQMITPQQANYSNGYHFGSSSTSTPNNTGYYYNYNNSNINYNNVYNNNNFNNVNSFSFDNNYNIYNQVNNTNISYSMQQPANSFQTSSSLSSSSSISPQMINNSYANNSIDYSPQYSNKIIQQNFQPNLKNFDSQIKKENRIPNKKIQKKQQIVPIQPSISNYANIQVALTNSDLWQKFNECTTEMIITKQGRRMFPTLQFSVTGLIPNKKYNVFVDNIMVDKKQWKFQAGKWISVETNEKLEECTRAYIHPDSPQTGSFWIENEIIFSKLKLTNNKQNNSGQVILNSMHRYLPRVLIKDADDNSVISTHYFDETEFIAVTAYQNTDITQLKIDNNPFAKGFRENFDRPNIQNVSPENLRIVEELFNENGKRGRNDEGLNDICNNKRKL